MNKWIIIIAELIWLAAVQEMKTPPSNIPIKCSINEKTANCGYYGDHAARPTINGFPKHVYAKASQLESMDISGNKYRRANFNEYSHLIRLDATHLEFVDVSSRNNFKNGLSKLKTLEELDTSGVKFFNVSYNLSGIIWPKKLSRLILSNMSLTDVTNLHLLQYLEELDLSLNSFQTLPRLNLTAPLITINLKDNPIVNISVLQIAPFCELQTFLLGGESSGNFTSVDSYNVCAPIERWLLEYEIEKEQFTCLRPRDSDASKNITFPSEAVKAHNECMARLPSTSIFELLLYAVFFAVLFPLLYFGNEAWNKYQSKKLAPPPTPVKRRRKKRRITTTTSTATTTTVLQKIDVEAGQSKKVNDAEREGGGRR